MKDFLPPLIKSAAPAGYHQGGHFHIICSFVTTQDPLWVYFPHFRTTVIACVLKFKSHISNNRKHSFLLSVHLSVVLCLCVCVYASSVEVGQVQACIKMSQTRQSSKEMHPA